jgi:hypothetical protein
MASASFSMFGGRRACSRGARSGPRPLGGGPEPDSAGSRREDRRRGPEPDSESAAGPTRWHSGGPRARAISLRLPVPVTVTAACLYGDGGPAAEAPGPMGMESYKTVTVATGAIYYWCHLLHCSSRPRSAWWDP